VAKDLIKVVAEAIFIGVVIADPEVNNQVVDSCRYTA
jgi:hypothetical protein